MFIVDVYNDVELDYADTELTPGPLRLRQCLYLLYKLWQKSLDLVKIWSVGSPTKGNSLSLEKIFSVYDLSQQVKLVQAMSLSSKTCL